MHTPKNPSPPPVATRPATPPGNFGNSEIAEGPEPPASVTPASPISDGFDLETILARCANAEPRSALFHAKDEQLVGLYLPYVLTYLMLEDPDVEEQVRQAYASRAERQRALKRGNVPLLALYVAAHPESQTERKVCSDLALVLQHAVDMKVVPGDFMAWGEGVTFDSAIMAARAKRRDAKCFAQQRSDGADTTAAPAVGEQPANIASSDGLGDVPSTSEAEHGVKLTIQLTSHDRTRVGSQSHYVTQAVANIIRVALDGPEDGALSLLYAIADAIEGRPWEGPALDRPINQRLPDRVLTQ